VRPPAAPPDVDVLHAAVLRAGEDVPALRRALASHAPDPTVLIALLRRAVPLRLLELFAGPPWSEDARVLAAVVLNPRAPAPLSLRLLPSLFWRDLAAVALAPRVAGPVRVRAEAILKEKVPDLRLGERIALAKIATAPVLPLLLADQASRVAEACLINPRLREEDLVVALRQETARLALLEAAGRSARWSENYAVRLELVLQPRTPLAVALAQLSALVPRDLRRVGHASVAQLLRVTALRLLDNAPAEPEPET
jgi:hypothetical protein